MEFLKIKKRCKSCGGELIKLEEMRAINDMYLGKLPSRRRRAQPDMIVVHHTCTGSVLSTCNVLKNRNLSTHFEIDKNGDIYRYLDPSKRVASHVGKYNSRSIGIDLTHREGAEFPVSQMEALAWLVQRLCEMFGINPRIAIDGERYGKRGLRVDTTRWGVYRHSNLARTQCPDGAPLEDYIIGGIDG